MLFQQIQNAQSLRVRGALGCSRKLGGSQIMFFTGRDRIGALTLKGRVASMSLCLGREGLAEW